MWDKNANDAVMAELQHTAARGFNDPTALPWIVRFWALELSQIDTYSFQALLCA